MTRRTADLLTKTSMFTSGAIAIGVVLAAFRTGHLAGLTLALTMFSVLSGTTYFVMRRGR
jgi:membrane protein implicated in regulation of membrane protease activity